MSQKSKPNEISITRIYDAPVKTVWAAWTDLKQVAQWWGPRGFTITTHSKELKNGGHWHYTMHGPDGVDYPNRTHYFEVEPYSRLVYDHGANEHQPPLFRVTVLFSELKGKTKMEMTMALATAEAATETRKFIKKAGGNATWDRLGEFLANEAEGKQLFFINRSFSVPIDDMYELWTNPDHLTKWAPPIGFSMQYIRADIRTGGNAFYVMFNESVKMYGRVKYLELTKPNRIVYTQEFSDEKENLSRHPMAPIWPETMLTTVLLTAEGPNETRVTLSWEPYGKVNADELAEFIKARGGMTQGWTGSFDKLESYSEGERQSNGASLR